MAIGTLISRVHRQETYCVSRPPRMSPIAAPPPEMPPKTPNARARSLGSVKVTWMSDSADGAMTAAMAPCRARAAKSMAASWASPPRAEAPANPSRLRTNMRLRPR